MCSKLDIRIVGGSMVGRNGTDELARDASDLRRSPLAWAKFLGFCAFIVVGPGLLLTSLLRPTADGNPMRNLTPGEVTRQANAQVEAREYRKEQQYWLARIEAGEASFGEAACVLDHGGDWDSATKVCASRR